MFKSSKSSILLSRGANCIMPRVLGLDSPGSSRRRRRRTDNNNQNRGISYLQQNNSTRATSSWMMQNGRNRTSNVNGSITNRQEQIDDIMEFSDNDEQQTDNNNPAVTAQSTSPQEDTNTQNNANPTDILLSAIQNSNAIDWNVIIPSLLSSMSTTTSNSTSNTAATQQQKIPIRVRLATSHSNSSTDHQTTQEAYKSYETTPNSSKLTTIFPPPVHLHGTSTTAVSTTISNYTQYIVEELFINNREDTLFQQQLDDDEEHRASALFNDILPNINKYNVIVSYYGKRMKNRRMKKLMKSIIDKSLNQDVNNSSTTSTAAKKPKCEIHFTLMEQLESTTTTTQHDYSELSGDHLAYETLHDMYINNGGNILDLILLANVIYPSSSSPHTTLQQQSMNVDQPVDNRKAPPEQLIQATATAAEKSSAKETATKKRKTVYDELEHSDISVASSHQRSPKRIKTGEQNNVAKSKTSEAVASKHPSKFTLFVL